MFRKGRVIFLWPSYSNNSVLQPVYVYIHIYIKNKCAMPTSSCWLLDIIYILTAVLLSMVILATTINVWRYIGTICSRENGWKMFIHHVSLSSWRHTQHTTSTFHSTVTELTLILRPSIRHTLISYQKCISPQKYKNMRNKKKQN